MQVQADLSQHLWKTSLGKGACHAKANAACACTGLAAGKLHQERVLSGLHCVVASQKGYVKCSLLGSTGSVQVWAELVDLTHRGALADGDPQG